MKKNAEWKKKKNKLRGYSLVILPDKTKIIFSYSNLRYLTKKQYLYLTNNRKKTAHFEPSFNSFIRCVNSDYFRVLSVRLPWEAIFIISKSQLSLVLRF